MRHLRKPVKYIKLILILLFLSSCSTNKSVVGLYGKCGKSYFACTQIELKSDKTFEYFIFMDVGGGTIVKGNWEQISSDSIKLNTFDQPKNPSTTFYGRVNGHSMKNIGIHDGDLLIVDKSLQPKDNKIAVCFIDGEFTVKRIKIEKDCIWLIAENEDYKSICVTADNDFIIWGIVINVIKYF